MYLVTGHFLAVIVRTHSREFDTSRLRVIHSFYDLYKDLKAYPEVFPQMSTHLRQILSKACNQQRSKRANLEKRRRDLWKTSAYWDLRLGMPRRSKKLEAEYTRADVHYRTLDSLRARWKWEVQLEERRSQILNGDAMET